MDGNGTGNRKSIGIEICYSKSGGDRFIKAMYNGAELAAYLLKKYGWGVDRLRKHQDWSGKHCLPLDCTELLTPQGWAELADIKVGDEVAQYNEDGTIEFVKVSNVVEPYMSEVLKVYKTEATPNHRMWVKQSGDKYADFQFKSWEEVLSKTTGWNIPTSGYLSSSGIPISDEELLLLAWVQGDGHYMKREGKNGDYYIGIEFHFSKERKAIRLCQLLDEAGYKYSYHIRNNGNYRIRLFGKQYVEHFEEYLDNKQFTYKLLNMSQRQFELFIKELFIIDGSVENQSYFSTIQQNYDVVSALCVTHGVRNNQTTSGSSTALTTTDRKYMCFSNESEISHRKTMVSCVTVPSGRIVIRQYGQPKIVGNCPHRILDDYGWQYFVNLVNQYLQGGITPQPVNPDMEHVTITYQTWDDVKNCWLPNVTDANDYAGISGHDVCAVYANLDKGNICYRVHLPNQGWLPEVVNRGDYAGIFNQPIDAIAMGTDCGHVLHYKVKLRNGSWLSDVTGYDIYDSKNGFAGLGDGSPIDGLQIWLDDIPLNKEEPKIEEKQEMQGFLDFADSRIISGWAYNKTDEPVEVHAHWFNSTGEIVKIQTDIIANAYREDLKQAGIGSGNHGFSFSYDAIELPDGTYTVKCYGITKDKMTNPKLTNAITFENRRNLEEQAIIEQQKREVEEQAKAEAEKLAKEEAERAEKQRFAEEQTRIAEEERLRKEQEEKEKELNKDNSKINSNEEKINFIFDFIKKFIEFIKNIFIDKKE